MIFVFVMQDGVLVNVGRGDVTADKQPFDSVEEEVWRIFGEHKDLQAENKRLREALEKVCSYRKWLKMSGGMDIHKIAEQALKG